MPYDYDRIINDCRMVDLDHPDITAPNDDALFGKATDIAQLRHNQAQNSAVGWSVQHFELTTSPGKAEYLIPQGEAFGKPVRVHTIFPQERYHITRKIPVVDIQDVDEYYYLGPEQAPLTGTGGGTNRHSAVAFQIYWKFGQPYFRIVPIPNETSQYRVWFETGVIPEPALADNLPVPDSYHRYLRISTSIAILSQCQWTRLLGDDPTRIEPERAMRIMILRRRDLLDGLLKQEIEFRKEYEDHIATSHQAGTGEGNPYGVWAEDYYY